MLGIMNLGRLFGLHRAKPVLSASFGTGNTVEDRGRQNNALWGINGVVSRTFEYWRGGIMSLYGLVGRLRAEISNLREEVCKWHAMAGEEKLKRKALKEKHKAEEKRLKEEHKAEEERLKEEHKAEEERLKERIKGLEERNKAVQEALKRAEGHIQTQARVRARALAIKGALEEVEASRFGGAGQRRIQQRRPRHRVSRPNPLRRVAVQRLRTAGDSPVRPLRAVASCIFPICTPSSKKPGPCTCPE
jgi:hypothetical protein